MSSDANSEQGQLQSNPRIAFSEKLDDLRAALDVLYISKNPSGRNKFREKWPVVAEHIFGATLIKYDNEGTENLEERKSLEESAELRRIALKKVIAEFEEFSVESGFLKLDYIGATIDKVGTDIAIFLYSEKVIERARPGSLKKITPVAPEPIAPKPQIIPDQRLSADEKEILQNRTEANRPTPAAKPLPPKGTLKTLFNWRAAQRS